MSQVVKIKEAAAVKPGTVDLRQDNRIGALLDEYESAAQRYREIKKEKDDLTEEIKDKLGDAKSALVDGWILKISSYNRREYVVKATVVDRIIATRKTKWAMRKGKKK